MLEAIWKCGGTEEKSLSFTHYNGETCKDGTHKFLTHGYKFPNICIVLGEDAIVQEIIPLISAVRPKLFRSFNTQHKTMVGLFWNWHPFCMCEDLMRCSGSHFRISDEWNYVFECLLWGVCSIGDFTVFPYLNKLPPCMGGMIIVSESTPFEYPSIWFVSLTGIHAKSRCRILKWEL